jgi:hypothetical protein
MNWSETQETRLTTSWMLSAPPKASTRLPKSTVMNGIAAPLATEPSAPSTMSTTSVQSANVNSRWNGTRGAAAGLWPSPRLSALAAADEAFASASLHESGIARAHAFSSPDTEIRAGFDRRENCSAPPLLVVWLMMIPT